MVQIHYSVKLCAVFTAGNPGPWDIEWRERRKMTKEEGMDDIRRGEKTKMLPVSSICPNNCVQITFCS